MAEETTNQEKQEGQKTLVSFIVGLLIGGMLVWAFSSPAPDDADHDTMTDDDAAEMEAMMDDDQNDTVSSVDSDVDAPAATPQLQVGDGSVVVNDQPAGNTVALASATYPVSEGWIGIRTYNDGQLGRYINGVVRFSESQGLVPTDIILQNPTIAGQQYGVVIFAEDGDFNFSTAGDIQIDEVFDTFTAQ